MGNPNLTWEMIQSFFHFVPPPRKKLKKWYFSAETNYDYSLQLIGGCPVLDRVSRIEEVRDLIPLPRRPGFFKSLASRRELSEEVLDWLWHNGGEDTKDMIAVRWDLPDDLRKEWLAPIEHSPVNHACEVLLERNSRVPFAELHLSAKFQTLEWRDHNWWRPTDSKELIQELEAGPSRKEEGKIIHAESTDRVAPWARRNRVAVDFWRRPEDQQWYGANLNMDRPVTVQLPEHLVSGFQCSLAEDGLVACGLVSFEDGRHHEWVRRIEQIPKLPWSPVLADGKGLRRPSECSLSLLVIQDGDLLCQWTATSGIIGWTRESNLPVSATRVILPEELSYPNLTELIAKVRQFSALGLQL
jgi:hypothetical protein